MSKATSPTHYRKPGVKYKACGETINKQSRVTSTPEDVTCPKCREALELWGMVPVVPGAAERMEV